MSSSSSSQQPSSSTLTFARVSDERTLRLHAVVAGEKHEGRSGRFLGLPLEVFLRIASFLEWEDLVQATHVCVAWRKQLTGFPALWSKLEGLDCAEMESVERGRVWAGRAKGALRVLEMDVNRSREMAIDVLPVVATLRQILADISRLDGARNLHRITLELGAYRDVDDIEPAYHLLSRLALFAEFSAVNLVELKVTSHLPRFPSGSPFFTAVPTLQQLTLTSGTDEPYGDARLPEFLSIVPDVQITICALRSLHLSCTSLIDSSFPSFPFLSSLKLANLTVSNLYGLLKSCSSTLTLLHLHQIRSSPPTQFFPHPPGGGPKDAPPILLLPVLESVELCSSSPVLWVPPTPNSPNFTVDAPMLRRASFAEQRVYDYETAVDHGEEGLYDPFQRLTPEALTTLLRTSSLLEELNVADIDLTTPHLFALSSGTALTSLTASFDPALFPSFPSLPFLTNLNLLFSPSSIRPSHLTHLILRLPARPLTILAPLLPTTPSATTLRMELRTLLLSLSPTQILHLPTSLPLDGPPNALSFEVVRQEIINLAAPALGEGGLGSGKVGAKVQAASQEVVEAAVGAMRKWQRRREDEWAMEWFAAQEGVELREE